MRSIELVSHHLLLAQGGSVFVHLRNALLTLALCVSSLPAWAQQPSSAPPVPGQNRAGMHVYIRAGLKSHGPGQHDYPQFLADWSKLLTMHGAVVDGSFHSPTAVELEGTDVILMYKG